MSDRSHEVIFQPEGSRTRVQDGVSLLEAAARCGIVFDTPCGGQGLCGKCRVHIPHHAPEPNDADQNHFDLDELAAGWRLGCQTHVSHDMTVVVPAGSRMGDQQILTDGIERPTPLKPATQKITLSLPLPSVDDQRAHLDRLREALTQAGVNGEARFTPQALADVTDIFRGRYTERTVVLCEDTVIAVEEGDTRSALYGVAVDVGTTTVVGLLEDLNTGERLATASRSNPQTSHGDDVISRIRCCMETDAAVEQLQQSIAGCLNDIIGELCEAAQVAPEAIYEIRAAGNTAMTHLLHGVSPVSLGVAPYVAAFRESRVRSASELGIAPRSRARLRTLPNIAGFVGGDTVGVILAADMRESDRLTLAIDIGTNGEIVLGDRRRIVTTSTAAGPAFEGARIHHGMRAARGAIDRAEIVDDALHLHVIGGARPRGLCGTGLIDLVARLVEWGVIDIGGRITAPEDQPHTVPAPIRARTLKGEGGFRFRLFEASATESGLEINLTQSDVRELQLAKGAIMAGAHILVRKLGVSMGDIEEVLLAGAFGSYIDPRSARLIGLIPNLDEDRLRSIGNAASAGARMALLSTDVQRLADTISRESEYIELAACVEFQQIFMDQMMLTPVAP